jgi:hypothetical protein
MPYQQPKIALSLEGRTSEVVVDDQRLGKAVVLLLLRELPTELVRIAQDSLQDVAPQTVDLLDITPLLGAETHNLSRFQATVIEEVSQTPLTIVRKHRLEDLPDFTVISALFFHQWFSWLSWSW